MSGNEFIDAETERVTVRTLEISKAILHRGKLLRIPAVGSSMFPTSHSGDTITVKPAKATDVSVGDVIVYVSGKRMIAHRLVAKRIRNNEIVLICQGDFFPKPDPLIEGKQVLGKVVAVKRNGRTIRFDTLWCRLIGLLLAKTAPLRPWFYPILKKVGRIVVKVKRLCLII